MSQRMCIDRPLRLVLDGLRQQFGRLAEFAAADHPVDPPRVADVVERIGGQDDQIGQFSWRDRTKSLLLPQHRGIVQGRGPRAAAGVKPDSTSNSSS